MKVLHELKSMKSSYFWFLREMAFQNRSQEMDVAEAVRHALSNSLRYSSSEALKQ